jgi:hypothetical protein
MAKTERGGDIMDSYGNQNSLPRSTGLPASKAQSLVSLKKAPSITNNISHEMVPRLLYEEKAQECMANEEQISVNYIFQNLNCKSSIIVFNSGISNILDTKRQSQEIRTLVALKGRQNTRSDGEDERPASDQKEITSKEHNVCFFSYSLNLIFSYCFRYNYVLLVLFDITYFIRHSIFLGRKKLYLYIIYNIYVKKKLIK